VVFAEKKTNAPIPGMQVQVKKNGKPHTTVKTDEHGFLPDLHGFSAGDQYEILVAKVTGGGKSLKTGIMKDVDATLAFLSPKAATTTTTQVHKGQPVVRKPATPPPAKPAVNAASTKAAAATAKQAPAAQPKPIPFAQPDSVAPIEAVTPALQVEPFPLPDHVEPAPPTADPEQTSIAPIEPDALDRDSALWDRLGELAPVEPVLPDDAPPPAGVPAASIGSMLGVTGLGPVLADIAPPVAAPPLVEAAPAPKPAPGPTAAPAAVPALKKRPADVAKAEQTRSESGHPNAVAKKEAPPAAPKPPTTKIQKTIAACCFPWRKNRKSLTTRVRAALVRIEVRARANMRGSTCTRRLVRPFAQWPTGWFCRSTSSMQRLS
jgi:hypothetical protein